MGNTYSKEITQEFLKEYNRLDAIKTNQPGRYEYFEDKYRNLIRLFSSCRNSLAHNTSGDGYPLLVSDSVLNDLKKLLLKMETSAYEVCIPIDRIKTIYESVSIKEVIALMGRYGYSYLPMLNNKGVVTHIVSEKSILAILDKWDGEQVFKDYKIKDFLPLFEIESSKEAFLFISRDSYASNCKHLFHNLHSNKKCKLILVTNHGRSDEPLLGLITPRDVMDL